MVDDTAKLSETAKEVLKALSSRESQGATVLALYGELGAGKTSFVQALAGELGVREVITSPTFVIEKLYDAKHPVFKKLVHIDAYRLKTKDELEKLGWRDLTADRENLIALEWADRVEDLLPGDALRVRFDVVDETTRAISY